MSLDEIREYVDADSLKYLKKEDLETCVKKPGNFCYACFTGQYPIPKTAYVAVAAEQEEEHG